MLSHFMMGLQAKNSTKAWKLSRTQRHKTASSVHWNREGWTNKPYTPLVLRTCASRLGTAPISLVRILTSPWKTQTRDEELIVLNKLPCLASKRIHLLQRQKNRGQLSAEWAVTCRASSMREGISTKLSESSLLKKTTPQLHPMGDWFSLTREGCQRIQTPTHSWSCSTLRSPCQPSAVEITNTVP